MTPRLQALLDLATHEGTPVEEARTAAMAFCKAYKKEGAPNVGPAKSPAPQQPQDPFNNPFWNVYAAEAKRRNYQPSGEPPPKEPRWWYEEPQTQAPTPPSEAQYEVYINGVRVGKTNNPRDFYPCWVCKRPIRPGDPFIQDRGKEPMHRDCAHHI